MLQVAYDAGWPARFEASRIGPDDPHPTFDADAIRLLLRDIFRSAGGSRGDGDKYDRVRAAERRAAVLITPRRRLHQPPGLLTDLVASGLPRTARDRVRTDG